MRINWRATADPGVAHIDKAGGTGEHPPAWTFLAQERRLPLDMPTLSCQRFLQLAEAGLVNPTGMVVRDTTKPLRLEVDYAQEQGSTRYYQSPYFTQQIRGTLQVLQNAADVDHVDAAPDKGRKIT